MCYLIPPYSVKGFLKTFKDINIDPTIFQLLDSGFTDNSSEIEIFFIERAYQLLKKGGMCVILLPQSILTGN